MAFEYDLSVSIGTSKSHVVTSIIPNIERTLTSLIFPHLIVDCAPVGADTSVYSDVIGLETKPSDSLTDEACEQVATGDICYRVHSEMTVYVDNTGSDVETVIWLAVNREIDNMSGESFAQIDPSITNIVVGFFSWVRPTSPLAANQDYPDRINMLERFGSAGKGHPVARFFQGIYDNKVLFWCLIVGLIILIITTISCLVYHTIRLRKEGKTLSMGCQECCAKYKENWAKCGAKCTEWKDYCISGCGCCNKNGKK